METTFVGLKVFRENAYELWKKASHQKKRLIITHRRQPVFELVPVMGDDEGIFTTEFMRGILQGEKEMQTGNGYSLAAVKARLKKAQ